MTAYGPARSAQSDTFAPTDNGARWVFQGTLTMDDAARVLDDADHRQGLRAGALRYAQSWTVDDVVGRLLEIARDDVDRMIGSRDRVSA